LDLVTWRYSGEVFAYDHRRLVTSPFMYPETLLVLESIGYALSNPNSTEKQFEAIPATAPHNSINQR
jgi:hypothetical protein